ncbi:mandelate racemase/muconate lactonizing enzyme family protein [Schauerella aestuarii]|uniref:mandelate racemase/muconate lactonizing enzyme family protein n=1 Tax=Schauerella aestuarii TaxID=2511204 RepID=UPI00137128B8|nr:mandelate racemase/muconate lactonizing enzyme family protein [Achromobacter aestuarii]
MNITQINGYHLRFKPAEPLGNARTFIRERNFLALEVKTDAGLSGWGEVFSSPWAAAALIQRQMAKEVINRSPLDHGVIYARLLGSIGYDKRGASMMAISALDMAMHDLAARAQNISVAQLLGGVVRDALPCYASGPFIREGADPYAHYERDIERYLKQGFKAVKPRAGISPRADAKMAERVRSSIGDDLEFMIDINQGYSSAAASQAVQMIEHTRPLWVEEPVHPEDLEGYQRVANATTIPIAGGEALGSLASFNAFIASGAPTVLQPDLTVCGGFTGYRKAAALAEAREICAMPHAFGTGINFCASLQMAAATPTRHYGLSAPYPWVEYDPTGNPLIELCDISLDSNGLITLPPGPGLGLELSPDHLTPWIVEHWSVNSP